MEWDVHRGWCVVQVEMGLKVDANYRQAQERE